MILQFNLFVIVNKLTRAHIIKIGRRLGKLTLKYIATKCKSLVTEGLGRFIANCIFLELNIVDSNVTLGIMANHAFKCNLQDRKIKAITQMTVDIDESKHEI